MTQILIELQGTILVYLAIGFFLKKVHLFTDSSDAFMSDFVLGVLLPMSVFVSFLKAFTRENLIECIAILMVAAIIEIVVYLITKWKFPKFSKDEMCVARYGLLVSNGGLVGTPVIEGLFGAAGVVYANVFLIPTRIMAFSAGESVFNPKIHRNAKEVLKALVTNKILIAVFLGIGFVFLNLKLPAFAMTALSNVGGSLGPMSLMLVGSLLGRKIQFHVSDAVKIIVLSILRQIVLPLILAFCLIPLNFSFELKVTMVLLIGMPIGSSCAVFANKYHGDVPFASTAVLISTLSCTVTLVALMPILERLFA